MSLQAGAGPHQDHMSGDLAPPWSAACQAQASQGTWLGTIHTPHRPPPRNGQMEGMLDAGSRALRLHCFK